MNYNLLGEPWIPVLYNNGLAKRVNIMEAFAQADRIRQIAASNPMDRVAILRFLLALLYWCKGSPPERQRAAPNHPLRPDWFKKLHDNKDCFNILGDGKRLYQDPTAKRTRPVTVLIQEVPSGNNFWHLRHSTDNSSGLCPACCTMGLLRLPLFAVSGLSGPGEPNQMAGINGVPPVYIVPWERSLLATLLANWTPCAKIGEPRWTIPQPSPDADSEPPLLTALTLSPRRVYLHEPVSNADPCVGCGAQQLPLVLSCEYQTAGKKENPAWTDPHALYTDRKPRRALRAPDLTSAGRFRMDRPWPELLARTIETRRLGIRLLVGLATHQAKNIDVWERTVDIPQPGHHAEADTTALRKWQRQGWAMEKRMADITRSEAIAAATFAAARPDVEARVSEWATELASGDTAPWHRAANEYSPMMAAAAKSLAPGHTTAAVERRRQISGLRPDTRPGATATQSRGRKRGAAR